jgi:Alpha/beta hydrolase family
MTNNTMQRRIYTLQWTRANGKFPIAKKYLKAGLIGMCVIGMYNKSVAQTSASPVKNLVLVHGVWIDGSGWKPVYDILVKDGYTVTLVQEPLTSFAEDVRATKRLLDQQQRLRILVGHSYGGSVITESVDSGVPTLLNWMESHRSGPGPVKSAFRSALKGPVHQIVRRNQIRPPQDHRADHAPQFPVTTRDASSETTEMGSQNESSKSWVNINPQ